jgi:hypothetical protein
MMIYAKPSFVFWLMLNLATAKLYLQEKIKLLTEVDGTDISDLQ